ncbi:MAG: hypothetical protein C0410_05390 [Anaerolinea sp.]|nr:hypothetical protein [Anaerolinea sp.]
MTGILNTPAILLDWDSVFFNKRIGKVRTHVLSQMNAEAVDEWAKTHQVDCVYYLAEGSNLVSSAAAENNGYHLVDLRVTYEIDLTRIALTAPATDRVRLAKESDLSTVRQMTRENHQISRFFADERFDREKSMELYEVWIEKDFRDKDHFLWVWDENDQPVAYTSASLNSSDHTAEIGLVGVHPEWRGRGLGLDFQIWVLTQLKALGTNHVEVVTQGRNNNAQNLYQRSGYRLKSTDLWYHKWYS